MLRNLSEQITIVAVLVTTTASVSATVLGPLPYRSAADSPFVDVALDGSWQVEDFEDGSIDIEGITTPRGNAFSGRTQISSGIERFSANSVAGDSVSGSGIGNFLVTLPSACAQSYPPRCPTHLRIAFDTETPVTMAGFVWTDAVRFNALHYHPLATISIRDLDDQLVEEIRLDQLPLREEMENVTSDDLFVGFIAHQGIGRLDINVETDQFGGILAIDHLQIGTAPLPGDMNRDGDVDFGDFIAFSGRFSKPASGWSDGDFNFDGMTTFEDFSQLAAHFGATSPVPTSPVPEPSGIWLVLLAVSTILWLNRCRRSVS